MEYKAVPLADSLEIEDERTVKSIFSVMGNVDSYNDVIMPGAYKKTIKERLPLGDIKVLWNHDGFEPPIATPQLLKELAKDELPPALRKRFPEATGALYGEVRFLDTPRGNEVLSGIKSGAITQNSIGFDAVKWDEEVGKGEPGTFAKRQRTIKEIRLWDISPVNWGANEATMNLKRIPTSEEARLQMLTQIADDLKAGRVLSTANLAKLKAALATLSDILLVAEPPEDEPKALTAHGLLHRLAIAERELITI